MGIVSLARRVARAAIKTKQHYACGSVLNVINNEQHRVETKSS
jgi:hypothetical protein